MGGFTPRRCGIATFTHDLCESVSLALPQADCFAGAVNDRIEGYEYPPRVRFEMLEKDLDSYRRAADYLNFENTDVLCVQHEFGIYGGPSGSHLLALLKEVRMPVVTTLHTVLRNPNPMQRKVMDELAHRSDRLVVMAEKGAEILQETYGIPSSKIDVIEHGIPDIPFDDGTRSKLRLGVAGRPVLMTFGLLGPGKGIEFAIEALPEIVRKHPGTVYLVLGATHPHLVSREGENYRLGLERLASDRKVKENVIFYNRFVSLEDLAEFIGATDIYLTPYLNQEQITSGTLAYVFGAGKAVVSTPYWHAQELLALDRGILVPFRDPEAIALAVCAFLDDPERLERTRVEAYRLGREMIWSSVAQKYCESFQRARADRKSASRTAFAGWTLASRPYDLPPLRLDHILRMSDSTGIFQHAVFNVPNFSEGYCTDDNARAFILSCLLGELVGESRSEDLDRLSTSYLAFLACAFDPRTGRFRNFMGHNRNWLEEAGSEDSHARAVWALGFGASHSRNEGHRRLCSKLLETSLSAVESFSSPRSWAFALLGIHEFCRNSPTESQIGTMRARLTDRLVRIWNDCATPVWPWFESYATYDNSRLSQALIASGRWMGHPEATRIGLESLHWLASIQKTQEGNFRPVGSQGFYVQGGTRAHFDQQPVEAQAMVSACLEAYKSTLDPFWQTEARRAFEWFLGRNDLGTALYDSTTGGCSDGLHEDRVNENQGAESTLAFHLALSEMNQAQHLVSTTQAAP